METEHEESNYVQALNWKLATVKIYLSADRAFIKDFADVGGSDFVFLPYPDIFKYKFPDTIDFGENGNQLWCEDDIDNAPPETIPNSDITCKNINTEHVIISGLTEESVYVQSLNGVIRQEFGETEKDENSRSIQKDKEVESTAFVPFSRQDSVFPKKEI